MEKKIINTNFEQTYEATRELCKTETDNTAETTLWDWMKAGYWQTMTPAEMAAEWDALSAEADDDNE